MKKDTKKFLSRTWGYLLLLVIGAAWFYTNVGPVPLALGSVLVLLFSLFAAPMPCCAETRGGEFCRNNGRGLLGGCHFKAHKWQNAKALVKRQSWARLGSHVFSTVSGNATAISAIAASASAVAAVATLALKGPPVPPTT